VDIRGT